MITAKEAREGTARFCQRATKELAEIEKRIIIAMNNGEYSATYVEPLHDQTKAELLRLGYILEESDWDRGDPRGCYYIKIKWEVGC